METLEEANAIGSLFVANRRWHSRQREGWFCAVGIGLLAERPAEARAKRTE
jgi:hypothetical protein